MCPLKKFLAPRIADKVLGVTPLPEILVLLPSLEYGCKVLHNTSPIMSSDARFPGGLTLAISSVFSLDLCRDNIERREK